MFVLHDSITHLKRGDLGKVVVSGSHGGVYSAQIAALHAVRAAIFHDAGVGLDCAGIGGLFLLDELGIPAAAVSHMTAEIGNAQHLIENGIISYANIAATTIGVKRGQKAQVAARKLADAAFRPAIKTVSDTPSRQKEKSPTGTTVWLLDSASLVKVDDAGSLLITGSHGGIVKSNGSMPIKAKVQLAVFNDAGVGCNAAGIGRLSSLEAHGIAAVTVCNFTAQIGNARSTWETGIISYANNLAGELHVEPGQSVQKAIELASKNDVSDHSLQEKNL